MVAHCKQPLWGIMHEDTTATRMLHSQLLCMMRLAELAVFQITTPRTNGQGRSKLLAEIQRRFNWFLDLAMTSHVNMLHFHALSESTSVQSHAESLFFIFVFFIFVFVRLTSVLCMAWGPSTFLY